MTQHEWGSKCLLVHCEKSEKSAVFIVILLATSSAGSDGRGWFHACTRLLNPETSRGWQTIAFLLACTARALNAQTIQSSREYSET